MTTLCNCGTIITRKDGHCSNPKCTGQQANTAVRIEKAEVIYLCTMDEEEFELVKPENVPDFCKDPETLGAMLQGYACGIEGDSIYYIARRKEDLEAELLMQVQAANKEAV